MTPHHAGGRLGVWIVGGRGSVAVTTVAGCAAVAAGFAPSTGLVTALDPFAGVGLCGLDELVFGGSDVSDVPLAKKAEELAGSGVLPAGLPDLVSAAVEAADAEIRPGIGEGSGEAPLAAIRRIQGDIAAFSARHDLAGVVVVNCATTEAPWPASPDHDDLAMLDGALRAGHDVLPPSSLYAYAAFDAGHPFVDFTPSPGVTPAALDELARRRGVPYAGRDGKTGETLVKSALAAVFVDRNLNVRSWTGVNLLGGGDGAALADPARAQSKLRSKRAALDAILGPGVESTVDIVHVADMGEWKTAWDRVGFDGFLGTRMRLEFTWEGADSALAAPLVLDLVRLVRSAHVAGHVGPLGALGFFFKDPLGTAEHRLDRQWEALTSWATGLRR